MKPSSGNLNAGCRWIWPACLIACTLAAAHVLYLPRATVDDAFISFRYAQNLVDGHGLVFNPGERVEGYSNFLWVILTAGGMRAGFEPVAWTRAMGAVALLFVVVCAAHLTHRLTRSSVAAFATAIMLAASTALCGSAMSGLETGLYALLITAAMTALAADRLTLASIAIGLAAITRPEGIGILVVAIVVILISRSIRHRDVIKLAVPCIAIVGALVVFRLAYYGQALPNSVQAKSVMLPMLSESPIGEWPRIILNKPGLKYVRDFLYYAYGPLVLLAVMPLLRRQGPQTAEVAKQRTLMYMLFACVAMGLSVAIYNFGDWMSSFRLLTPYLPALTVLFVCGLCRSVDILRSRDDTWLAHARLVAACIVAFCAARQFQLSHGPVSGSPDLELANILQSTRQPDLLATTDVLGRLGYYAPSARIIDMAGLTDAHIARFGIPRPPFGRNDFDYVLSRKPHFIMNNVRTAWHRHLDKPELTDAYWWVDRPAWTLPKAAGNKPRYVFVRRGSVLESELRRRYFDARFRLPAEITRDEWQPDAVAATSR